MAIKFVKDEHLKEKVKEIIDKLKMDHIDIDRLICIRSYGSKSKNTIARCYALSKIWQLSLNKRAHYVIEVISEKFDKLPEDEKTKVLIHELLHIPYSFGGGFKHHKNWVTKRRVEKYFEEFKRKLK